MLKYFIAILISFLAIQLSAQEATEDISKKSELKLNTFYMILGALEVDYEYILNDESSIGLSATYVFEDNSNYSWGLTPHYRLFFGSQPALGFFVEGHGAVFGYETRDFIIDVNGNFSRTTRNITSAGLGIAVGGKFKTRRDVVVEIVGGLGRVFSDDFGDVIYPRWGINIGKRF